MKKTILLATAALLICPATSQAQWFGRAKTETPVVQQAVQPEEIPAARNETAEEETPYIEPTPVTITAEQIVNAKKPLMKNIQITTANASVNERKQLLDAIDTLDKIKARRSGTTVTDEADVNANDRKAVQKYLNEKFVVPASDSLQPSE